jgi:RHS repeat-associated protein
VSDLGYTGHRSNNTGANDLGLIYMNARYYIDSIGRFASADTIVPDPANPQSYNRYAYSLNNPVRYLDPTGHVVTIPCWFLCEPGDSIDISHWGGFFQRVAWVRCALLFPCNVDIEDGVIHALSSEAYVDYLNGQMLGLAAPLSTTGSRIVSYGGKSFLRESLENVLNRGKKYVIDGAGYLVERLPGAVREHDVIRYGARVLRRGSGLDAHHGVMSAWFEGNRFAGYSPNDAPAIMLHPSNHQMANSVFDEWATAQYGSPQNVDWTVVTQDEMMELARQMLNAAGVPYEAQTNYFATFFYYTFSLGE